jgi:hypothetical protein
LVFLLCFKGNCKEFDIAEVYGRALPILIQKSELMLWICFVGLQ